MNIIEWLKKRKSIRHDRIKDKLKILKDMKELAIIYKHPQAEIKKLEKKIARLERKLVRRL
jgi:hypothetical protein